MDDSNIPSPTTLAVPGRKKVVVAGAIALAAVLAVVSWLFLRGADSLPSHEGFLYTFDASERGTCDLWGFVDCAGKVVVRPEFREAYAFSEGLCMVRTADGKFGFIDATGKFAIPPTFIWTQGFHDGLAHARTADGKRGFINHAGEFVFELPPGTGNCFRFSEGLAFASLREDAGGPDSAKRKYGYLDTRGKWAIPARFDDAGDFYEGHAAVKVGDRWGVIDKNGRLVVEPIYDEIKWWSTWSPSGRQDVLIPVKVEGLWGAVDTKGKLVVEANFKELFGFHCGLASAQDDAGKYGYINAQGDWAISPRFDWASDFENDRAAVWVASERFALIDVKGNTVVSIPFTGKLHGWQSSTINGAWQLTGFSPYTYIILRTDGTVIRPRE